MNIKIGDTLVIHCYKHNGMIYKTYDKAIVLDITKDYIVLGNDKVLVTKSDGRRWRTRESAIMFFYYNRWFNIIAQLKSHGLFYYCNIASPFVIDNRIVKYIDYDLDLRVFADGAFKILDRNEYNYHRKLMRYPEEINIIIKNELSSLIEMKKTGVDPFNSKIIEKYLEVYKNIVHKN
jgi:protein associated with RNAse G/E